jgi:hypothetical protein
MKAPKTAEAVWNATLFLTICALFAAGLVSAFDQGFIFCR